jgi:hypothetical protein
MGIGAILWGALTYPKAAAQITVAGVSNRILRGEQYRSVTYDDIISRFSSYEDGCHPKLTSVAVVRLARLERATAEGERNLIDLDADELRIAIRRSLACFPSDPYLWTVLYWLENTVSGFSADNFMLLRLSYRLGPNEGWIILRRNRLALALYEQLPPDLAGRSLVEFAGLVRSRFYEEAVDIFVSAGAPPRDKLISRLAELDELDRRAFGKVLLDRGYSYAIPGLDRREPRPWH